MDQLSTLHRAFYRAEFFKLLDAAINQQKDRFDQPGIRQCMTTEELLSAEASTTVSCSEHSVLELDCERLAVQLAMFRQLHQFKTVQEAAAVIADMPAEFRGMFQQVEKTLVRLLLVVPASSAEAELSVLCNG